ncbi:hypothetical protein [Pedobacter sandarakinus]|uniref:hypothetical protein n=1 Tax=Pedobacter sandarakinus TaxID=353156 RepID=UPI002247FB4F|nr:hypothetical protein [Pedobacter sandarakinus]MCX2574416.1 hypothetical protein [Pedobacter sandarakinus]
MKIIRLLLSCILLVNLAHAQGALGVYVKTDLLNLLAKQPAIAVEKVFNKRYGIELSYAKGELNWGREYQFEGVLMRGKVYTTEIKAKEASLFYGAYAGVLNKKIVANNGYKHPTGFLAWGHDLDFIADSFRAGGTLGVLFIPKRRFFLETTTGLGYGKYYNVKTFNGTNKPSGYLDVQLNLSVGYSF